MTDSRLTKSIRAIYPNDESGLMAFDNTINLHWRPSVRNIVSAISSMGQER
jgi:hypothetical protein